MKYVKLYLLLFFVLVIQTVLSTKIKIMGVFPELVFVCAICVSVKFDRLDALVFAFVSGLLTDFTVARIIGLNAFLTMAVCLLVSVAVKKYFYNGLITTMVISAISTFIYQSCYFFLKFFIWGVGKFSTALINIILPLCVYNFVICAIIYFIINKLFEKQLKN